MPFDLAALAAVIAARAGADAESSYTRSLLEAGPKRAARKFGEEALEAVIAAVEADKAALKAEAADVLYHLLVMLEASGVSYDEVMAELGRRTGRSGHAEKASRDADRGKTSR